MFKERTLAKACKTPSSTVQEVQEEFFIEEVVDVDAVYDGHKGPWTATISVDEQTTKFMLESGADITVIAMGTYHNLKPQVNLKPTSNILLGPCNYKMDCIGKFTAKLSTHSMMVKETSVLTKD